MPTPNLKGRREVRYFASDEDVDRLRLHAKRIGCDMSDIARNAMLEKLTSLDQQALAAREAKKILSQPAKRPYTMPAKLGKVPGLGLTDEERDGIKQEKVIEKVRLKFRSFAELIEGADGPVDAGLAARTVRNEIKLRTNSHEDYEACLNEFELFMKERVDAKTNAPTPKGATLVPTKASEIPTQGDAE